MYELWEASAGTAWIGSYSSQQTALEHVLATLHEDGAAAVANWLLTRRSATGGQIEIARYEHLVQLALLMRFDRHRPARRTPRDHYSL